MFSSRSTGDLMRMYLVLKACSINPLVKNADALVRSSRRVLGDGITFGVMRHTFMKQFCAGEDEDDIMPTINMLRANGIRAIIDYAAEDDVAAAAPQPQHTAAQQVPSSSAAATEGSGSSSAAVALDAAAGTWEPSPNLVAVGRQYSYENEATCDKHVEVFLKAIDTVARLPDQGFAAIKVTALGNPQLLERMSAALVEIRNLFGEADTDGDGFVTQSEFEKLFHAILPKAQPGSSDRAFAALDLEGHGKVDYVSWSHRIRLADMPAMVARIRRHGTSTPLSNELCAVALTREEVGLADALLGRVAKLAAAAADKGVRLMIDAEHTYFQPAIDHTTQVLSLKYNRGQPVIFNTYQAYLKDSHTRLMEDMERARREGYVFAAKLVRGAYVKLERARAAELGYPSPIWDNIDGTHANFDRCLDAVLEEVADRGAHVMVASHNQVSIERAVAGMAQRGLPPSGSGVYFGQLLGMSDNLSFTLGHNGYEVYKYVPYGPIELVMPYLIRRAHENSAIMGAGVSKQLDMIRTELARRLKHPLAAGGLFKHTRSAAASA